jgi:hypothetical protein
MQMFYLIARSLLQIIDSSVNSYSTRPGTVLPEAPPLVPGLSVLKLYTGTGDVDTTRRQHATIRKRIFVLCCKTVSKVTNLALEISKPSLQTRTRSPKDSAEKDIPMSLENTLTEIRARIWESGKTLHRKTCISPQENYQQVLQ